MELSWAAFWALLGSLLSSLGPLGLPFGLSWGSLGPLLDPSWAFLDRSWQLLRLSWDYLGPSLAYLCSWWPSVAHWGSLSSSLWPFLGSLLALLDVSWGHFGLHVVLFCGPPEGYLRASGAIFGLPSVEQGLLIPRTSSSVGLCALQSGLVPCSLHMIFANSRALIATFKLLRPVNTITQGD